MTKHEPLEELENLIKNHFGDLLVSVAVSASGSLFLSIWQQPSEHSGIYMNYLPLFYIICGVDEYSKLSLKLIAFNGKVLEELIAHEDPVSDDAKIEFISKLTRIKLCQGVKNSDNELKLDPQTFAYLYLVEQLEKNVIIRSRQCRVGLFDGSGVCQACSALDKENITKAEDNKHSENELCSPTKRGRGRPRVTTTKENNHFDGAKKGRGRTKAKIDYNDDVKVGMLGDGLMDPTLYNEDVKPFLLKNVKVELVDNNELDEDSENCDDNDFNNSIEDHTENYFDTKLREFQTAPENLEKKNSTHLKQSPDLLDKSLEVVAKNIDIKEKKYGVQFSQHIGHFSDASLKHEDESLIGNSDHTSIELNEHPLNHKPFMCDECGKSFRSAANLHTHLEDFFHKSKETAVCFECGDILETRVDFRKHLWSHNNLKPYKCKECNFTSTVKEHIYNQHAVHTHGKCGTEDDVEILMDVMEKIDIYEDRNQLRLGPSMARKRKRAAIREPENSPTKKGPLRKDHVGRKPGRPRIRNIEDDIQIKQEIEDFTDEVSRDDESKPTIKRGRPGKIPKFDLKPKDPPKQRFKEECSICLCIFNSKEDFDKDQIKHQEQLANQEMVQCPTCAVSIGKVHINHHYMNDHPELKAGCCIECITIIAPRSKMSKHVAAVHKPKNDLCPICGKNFRNVRDHVAVKHGDKVRNHVCDTCGKKFTHALLLSAHISKIHSVRKQLPCKFCGQIFMEKNPLRFHYWAIHLKVKPYKCKHCHYCGTQPQKIYEHCRSVHKFPGGKKDVEHVEEDFARIREFETQHGLNRQEFKASREFLCWLCKKDCQSNQGLLKHEFGHLNLSPFECKQCGMKFKMKVLLQSHLDKRHNVKVSASIIEGNPEIMSLYERIRKIPQNIIEVYDEYKNPDPVMVLDDRNSDKRLMSVCCKKCQQSNLTYAEFLDHFHKIHGYEFSHLQQQISNVIESDVVPDSSEMLRCKCCGFETLIPDVLQKHIAEVHRFTQQMYDQFIEAPKVEPTQKMYRPRKYRCRYCLVYTAVKKFTVHRHIRNTHGVQETFEHDVLLIAESEHLLHSIE